MIEVGSFLFLCILALLGPCALSWMTYWCLRGSQTGELKPNRDSRRWIVRIGLGAAIMFIFPPMRRAGDWRNGTTGEVPASEIRSSCDTDYFGYTPSYRLIWMPNDQVDDTIPCTSSPEGKEVYSANRYHWFIEWWVMVGQLVYLLLFMLPFIKSGTEFDRNQDRYSRIFRTVDA